MKEISKLIVKELSIIAFCAFMGVAALAITYLIPNDDIRENVIKSSVILYNETTYPYLWEGIEETLLDNFTDGLIYNVSYTETEDGIRDILLDTYVETLTDTRGKPMVSLYETLVLSNNEYQVSNYGRYWHGYQIIIRPLSIFFTYSDIRRINMIFQLVLVFILIYILARSKDRVFIIPFFVMYIFLSPVSLFSSLQYSSCFYIMMLTLIVLFGFKRYLNNITRNYLFVLAGIATAYFDLLTYPFVTLGVPLIAYLGSDFECLSAINNRQRIQNTFSYTASWTIGYVGMWSSKWIIASILTEENVIYNAFEQIKLRSGYSQSYTYFETLKQNLEIFNIKFFLIVIICFAIFTVIYKIKKKLPIEKKIFPCIGIILFVTMYPFIWFLFTKNHSYIHAWFTWREFAISVFGICVICAIKWDFL